MSPAPYVKSPHRAPPIVVQLVDAVGCKVVKEKHRETREADAFRVPCSLSSEYWCPVPFLVNMCCYIGSDNA